jgi:putative ABC transport system permease protein
MKAVDIGILPLILGFLLILFPIAISYFLKVKLIKPMIIGAIRMGIQLLLIGFFLEYLFELNSWLVNILWLLVMIVVASLAMISNSELKIKYFFFPVLLALGISTFLMVIFFNTAILKLDNIFDARYLIALGGMILGNSLKGNIVALSSFYGSLKKQKNEYEYLLCLGASRLEALLPFFRNSFKSAINPFIASMATYGIVSLPGMMTGQILGGTDPLLSVKYQIVIVTAIFAVNVVSIVFSFLLTYPKSIDGFGVLRKGIFK